MIPFQSQCNPEAIRIGACRPSFNWPFAFTQGLHGLGWAWVSAAAGLPSWDVSKSISIPSSLGFCDLQAIFLSDMTLRSDPGLEALGRVSGLLKEAQLRPNQGSVASESPRACRKAHGPSPAQAPCL